MAVATTKSKMLYFSERENGEAPREKEEINERVWRGIQALITTGVQNGSFGAKYRLTCPDGTSVVDTDVETFKNAMAADIPGLPEYSKYERQYSWNNWTTDDLSTPNILDIVQFCWRSIGKPIKKEYHEYFQHYHLEFDEEEGRNEFRRRIETIFRRNGIAYELTAEGRIERLVPPVFCEALVDAHFNTGDHQLDDLLRTAQEKFIDPDPDTRREALEPLWDAWERLKTVDQDDKKSGITAILDATAGSESPKFRGALKEEATTLTEIGNSLRIRHSETDQEKLAQSEHADYLFYRLYSLIHLILRLR